MFIPLFLSVINNIKKTKPVLALGLSFFFFWIHPHRVLLPDHDGGPPDVVVELHGNLHVVAVVGAEWVQHFDANKVPVEQQAEDQ